MRAAGSTFFFLWLLVYYMLGSIGKAFAERNKVTAVSCEFDTVQVDCAAGVSPAQSGCWRYRVFGCKGSTALMGVLWVCAFHWERTCFQECLFRELCLHLSQWFFLHVLEVLFEHICRWMCGCSRQIRNCHFFWQTTQGLQGHVSTWYLSRERDNSFVNQTLLQGKILKPLHQILKA